MNRVKVLFGFVLALVFSVGIGSFSCSATTLPSLNIDLKGVTLEDINAGDKDKKYGGNDVNLMNGGVVDFFTDVEIKGRGNTTWTQPKKPYQLKFHNKENLFNMGKAKKWVLLANYLDPSFLRNDTAFYLAELLHEPFAPKSKFVDFSADQDYVGLYQLTTKVEIGTNRVNLKDPLGALMELDDIWYKAEKTRFNSINGDHLVLKENVSEDDPTLTDESLNDFKSSWNALERALNNRSWSSVKSLIDIDSFVIYCLIAELSNNVDAYSTSMYFYKDGVSDKIHAGPVWDFDKSFANPINTASQSSRKLMLRACDILPDYPYTKLFAKLSDFPEFRQRMKELFKENISGKTDIIVKHITSMAEDIRQSALRDSTKWSRLDFDQSVEKLKSWVIDHIAYLEIIFNSTADIPSGEYTINSLGTNLYFDKLSDGSYRIFDKTTGKALDVYNNGSASGTHVCWYEYHGGTNQRWYVISGDNGSYYIISKLTGLALELNLLNMSGSVQELDSNKASQQYSLSVQKPSFVVDETLNYEFVSVVDNGFVVDVNGASKQAGTNIQLWSTNDSSAQSFFFKKQADNSYVIYNSGTNNVLDVYNNSKEAGANVQIYPYNGGDNQKWYVFKNTNGSIYLMNVGSLKALDLYYGVSSNGVNIQQWNANNGTNQKWVLRLVEKEDRIRLLKESRSVLTDGLYTIKLASNPQYVLDVYNNSKEAGANVQIYPYNGGDNQKWYVKYDDKGYITIINKGARKPLDVFNNLINPGTNVEIYDANGGANQKWIPVQTSSYTIRLASGLNVHRALDLYGGVAQPTSNIDLWTSNSSLAQQWVFERIGD